MKWLGMDLGTDHIRIFNENMVYVSEPLAVTMDTRNRILLKGQEAAAEKVLHPHKVHYPLMPEQLQPQLAAEYVQERLRELHLLSLLKKPNLIAALPVCMQRKDHYLFVKYLRNYGVGQINTYGQLELAVAGSGFHIDQDFATCFLHIGASECLLAVYVKSRRVAFDSYPMAGNQVDEAIRNWLRQRYGIDVVREVIDQIRQTLFHLLPVQPQLVLPIEGIEIRTGRYIQVDLPAVAVQRLFEQIARDWVIWILADLQRLPESMQMDIRRRGIIAAGGMFCRQGLDSYLSGQLGCPVYVPQQPEKVVWNGILRKMQDQPRRFHKK